MPGAVALTARASSGSAFRLVHGGIGGGIDDDAGFDRGHHAADGLRVGQIHFPGIHGDDLAQGGQGAGQFPADLAATAGEKDFHG
jgi:hypothetical protein